MSSARLTTRFARACRAPQQQRLFSASAAARKEIQEAYILSGARTPTGVFNGGLASVPAPVLGSHAIRAAIERSSVPQDLITDVYMGQVLQAASGQSPARQAAIFAGLSSSVEATTINKVCASGMKAISVAAANIQLGLASAQIAGGMENMSRVPYYLPRAAQQPAFGDQKLVDGLVSDGLWDVYNQVHMGNCAENAVKKLGITREEQDEFAILSYKRAQEAWGKGLFKDEIVPVVVKGKKGDTTVAEDEGYNKLKLEKVPTLKPAFDRSGKGSVTAANSSSFNDGASALVLGSREVAKKYGKGKPLLARIVATADAAVDPIDFPIAPAKVVPLVLERAGITKDQVKVWEFNEAFAAVIKANAKLLDLGVDNVNPRGGAIALGHAIGSSGSRIVVTLLHQLKKGEYGVAAICNGGGAATGIVVQMVDADDL
ncbi:thiolase [Myriangium duriaei CBS 260.36]|uniref:acetyl-CoA C-acetyltransferase n=1 Tax=Myriangium duriaei CBS 260.36 TaxID=1168546 RepID=A0A9P4MDV8_9PEZI|nr:thiolase [Myriangium duriaei CBS 260.36]